MNSDLLNRFLDYVRIDTMADEKAGRYPSSEGQWTLGRLLVDQLRQLGLSDVRQDEHGLVFAAIPGTVPDAPTIAWCAHLDTSPETPAAGIRPQVIADYPGGDIALPGDPNRVIRVAENPELAELVGRTIITSDGTTLLGADDKAGIAAIVEAAARLMREPTRRHGPIRLCFTCDEEIGRGVEHLDPASLGAEACYTLDGHGRDEIDVETFSADLAIVTVRGRNIHPAIAKGKMINAVRGAADFVARLPRDRLAPEATEGREGFLHPYEVSGGVAEVRLRILLRDFDTAKLSDRAEMLQRAAEQTMTAVPGTRVNVEIVRQYRNMADGLARHPRVVGYARLAIERLGRQPRLTIVRGGTDGARLTELGLPTPNLSCGEHNPHSPLEWTCLEEIEAAAETLVSLAEVWAEQPEDYPGRA